ncbi:MAG: TonB-dependent receptor plug domain-containing protein [Thermodesulfobacteriota bacterium]
MLERHSERADETRLNADFVPGMVTVLYGDELEARGVRTVGEALTLVPGMDLAFTADSFWQTVVRGVPKIFASGHIEILLDGAPLATAFGVDPVVNMPAAQVSRLEIIRGPGSAIHGENAVAGVLNVITRKSENRAFAGVGSFDTFTGGGVLSLEDAERNLAVHLNVAGLTTDGADVDAGADTLYGGDLDGVSYDAGETNEEMDYAAAFLSAELRGLSLNAHYIRNRQGDVFGAGNSQTVSISRDNVVDVSQVSESDPDDIFHAAGTGIPPAVVDLNQATLVNEADRSVYETDQWGVSTEYRLTPVPDLEARIRLGWQREDFSAGDARLRTLQTEPLPPPGRPDLPGLPDIGIASDPDPVEITVAQNGWVYGLDSDETVLRAGLEFTWKGWKGHTLLAGYAFEETRWSETGDGGTERDRIANRLLLEETFRASDRLTLTAGLRFDAYDDLEDQLSPRLAAAFRWSRHHVFKAQYARAFRPPSFLEMKLFEENGGRIDLSPETADTFELGYIYRRAETLLRATLFHTELDDWIQDGRTGAPASDFQTRGVELEAAFPLIPRVLLLDASLSFADAEDEAAGAAIPGSAKWLAGAGLRWRPVAPLWFWLQYRFVGDRAREPGDPRDDLDGYQTVDLTGTFRRSGWTVGAGVKNLFEDDVRYPSRLGGVSGGDARLDRPDDYPRPERTWWLQVTREF